jgi:hypothetical protein
MAVINIILHRDFTVISFFHYKCENKNKNEGNGTPFLYFFALSL